MSRTPSISPRQVVVPLNHLVPAVCGQDLLYPETTVIAGR